MWEEVFVSGNGRKGSWVLAQTQATVAFQIGWENTCVCVLLHRESLGLNSYVEQIEFVPNIGRIAMG